MIKFPVKYFNKIVPDAFHGTELETARKIRNDKKFIINLSEQNYLGDGVYFYEASLEHAKIWGRRKSKNGKIGVIRSAINLGRCLDLHNKDHLNFLRETANGLSGRTKKVLTDTFVINFVAQLADNSGNKIDTIRATHARNIRLSAKIFRGSRFYYDIALMICVRNLKNIITCSLIYKGD
ncbi:MAG: hypothetical protein HQ552_03855 [Desulfobacteraceae bacterium]|nr:hypothetical protein [Desulfobacteraceae bacterium]